MFGLVAFILGCVGALAVAAYHWWIEAREIADLEARYGSRNDQDT
jgi:hypothetical protein